MTVADSARRGRGAAVARALAWLGHPVSVAAIALLVVNDHVLKESYANWWTGKLSDVAGLVYFPSLVALMVACVAPALRWRRAAMLSVSITAVGFAWIKATALGAATASALWSGVGGASVVVRDRTDLFALPALVLAWWASHRRVRPAWGPRLRAALLLPVALLATVATSRADRYAIDDVAEVDGVIYAHEVSITGPVPDTGWVIVSPDEVATEELTQAQAEALAAQLGGRGTSQTPVCIAETAECFRPTPGRYGVDVSRDGGVTWQADMLVTDTQWSLLALNTPGVESKETELVTGAVTAAEVAGETIVIAANGADGLSIRHEDGRWERVGWWGKDYEARVEPMPPDDPSVDMGQVPFPVAGGLLGSALAYVVASAARRKRRRRLEQTVHYVVGGTLLLIAARLGAVYAAQGAQTPRMAHSLEPFPELNLAVAAVILIGGTAGGVAVLGWRHRVSFLASAGWAVLAGAGGAIAGVLAGQVFLWGIGGKYAVTLAVAGGLAAWFAWGLRRPRQHPPGSTEAQGVEVRVDDSGVAPDA